MIDVMALLGRDRELFREDLRANASRIRQALEGKRILVVGGAGSIGRSVVADLYRAAPAALHVADLSENGLVELVRDIRSSAGDMKGDFSTFCVDCLAGEFKALAQDGRAYDLVLNFAALKHVRSERDPFTLMRMIRTNVIGTMRLLGWCSRLEARRFFSVSTDKAANPASMMGASKRIMELSMFAVNRGVTCSSARFANVAFSDGSLLESFERRFEKRQPIVAPTDIVRYFITHREAARLCLMAMTLAQHGEIFIPEMDPDRHQANLAEVARRFLQAKGYEPVACDTDEEARSRVDELLPRGKWPCWFFTSDTTGEKPYEEFHTDQEQVDRERFNDLGVILPGRPLDVRLMEQFEREIETLLEKRLWTKAQLVDLFARTLGTFEHEEKHRSLDQKM